MFHVFHVEPFLDQFDIPVAEAFPPDMEPKSLQSPYSLSFPEHAMFNSRSASFGMPNLITAFPRRAC